jgi:hypothetical protein
MRHSKHSDVALTEWFISDRGDRKFLPWETYPSQKRNTQNPSVVRATASNWYQIRIPDVCTAAKIDAFGIWKKEYSKASKMNAKDRQASAQDTRHKT